jgi:hypothetical protein
MVKERTPKPVHLISQGSEEVLHGLSIVLSELSKVLLERLVQSRPPVLANYILSVCLKRNEILLPGFSAHDLEPV